MTPSQFPWRLLGQLLVERGLLGPGELEEALAEQRQSGRRLGEILVARKLISGAELICVLAAQYGVELKLEPGSAPRHKPTRPSEPGASPWRPLGRLLVEKSYVTEEQLSQALAEQRESGRRLGEILVDRGLVSPLALADVVAEQHGLDGSLEADALTPVAAGSRRATAGEPVYEARDVGDTGRVLFRSGSFLEATDFAFELLEAKNPAGLEIFKVRGGDEERVWAYDEKLAAETAGTRLVEVFGYDVARWSGPPSYSPDA